MLAKIDIVVVEPYDSSIFQTSFEKIGADQVIVVTGPGTYKYYKLEEQGRSFKEVHS